MSVLYNHVFFFFTSVILPVLSQNNTTPASTSSLKIGSAACYIYGDYDKDFACALETVLCDQLPHECSSYIWQAASVSLDNDVHPMDYPVDTGNLEKLTKCAEVPVILEYGYNEFREWSIALACCGADGMNVQNEVEGLNAYLSRFGKISGLILSNLDITPEQPNFQDFSKNLKCYIQSLKKLLPGMEIGIVLFGTLLQMYYDNPIQEWIDFKDLCNDLDFVLITFSMFNDQCTPELKNIGVAPITGDFKYTIVANIYYYCNSRKLNIRLIEPLYYFVTQEKTQKYLNKAGIPKEKLILATSIDPKPKDSVVFYSPCEVNPSKMCKDPKASAEWCAPSTQFLYDFGVYTKKNAMGFAAINVDLDDVHCDCQCDRSFPLFRAFLDGYNGAPRPRPCPLIDRC